VQLSHVEAQHIRKLLQVSEIGGGAQHNGDLSSSCIAYIAESKVCREWQGMVLSVRLVCVVVMVMLMLMVTRAG